MNAQEIINHILIETGLDIQGLAEATGVDPNPLYKMNRGETKKMRHDTAKKIHEVFPQFSIAWLTGKDNKVKNKTTENKQYSIEDHIAKRVAKEVEAKYEKQFNYLKEQLGEINEKLNELLVHREIELEQEKNKNRKLTDS